MEKYEVVVAGGGILGTTLAYWLSSLYEARIALLEMEPGVACHTSGRNTGVIHRPFYLHPEKRRIFARCAQGSYRLWKDYARAHGLPWKEVGTLEVAVDNLQLEHVHKYMDWAVRNGMEPDEVEYLTGTQVKKLEPNVECLGAIYAKTEASVDYRVFTEFVKKDAAKQGVQFIFRYEVRNLEAGRDGVQVVSTDGRRIQADFFINCAGGNAMDLAHKLGVGKELTDLHFRGEYWEIDPRKAGWVGRNIYTVPKHPDIPFLDPHWIVHSDGRREIGPNAVLVAGSAAYRGLASGLGELVSKIFEAPMGNKLRLFTNADFLKLAAEEWRSSIFKDAMLSRVQKFIPALETRDLARPGTAGIRSPVIDAAGNFLKEAVELYGERSFHILNYNSPGATGAPAYTAHLADRLGKDGRLSFLKKRSRIPQGLWDFPAVISRLAD